MPRKLLVVRRKGKLKTKSKSVMQFLYISRSGKQVIKEFPLRDLDTVLVIGRDVYIESGVFSVLASMNIPVAVIARDNIGIFYEPYSSDYTTLPHAQISIRKDKGIGNSVRIYQG